MNERTPTHLHEGRTSLLKGNVQEINDRLFAILDSVYDGLYITDGDAVTVLVNQAYQSISGLTPGQVLGKNMRDIVSQKLIDQSGTLLALKERTAVTLEQTFPTGKRALITSTPCFDESGNISMVITVVRDMTELYSLQEKFRQSEERRLSEVAFLQRHQKISSQLLASDPQTLTILSRARRVAALNTTVLLLGETGVGKEQFARYIFENSARAGQSFISINCGAIPSTLIGSELFGYERGAFTGANREGKMGAFESADKGTVFLDEIGDLPLEQQVYLLRVLQEMRVRRIGGSRDIPVDVRIIAATNQDLLKMVKEKTFREDLYYRLNVVPIHIPPLRERVGDIEVLAQSFLAEMNKKYRYQKTFSAAAMDALCSYSWPGNVRELKNVIEQAVILSSDTENAILPSDLPITISREQNQQAGQRNPTDLKQAVAKFEYEHICRAYQKYGNVRAAAASLGINEGTLVRKRQRYEEMLQNRNE